ncbi:MAG: S41 family peptidase [Candidatus Pacebacteria bacterium]|nr:S41 family peptidase [Candidatus Paceibacterota bacterium]
MNSKSGVVFGIMLALLWGAYVVGVRTGEGTVRDEIQLANVVNTQGDVLSSLGTASSSDPVDFAPYWRVWNLLEKKFIPFSTTTDDSVAPENRLYSSIEGLVSSYGDPYTVFMRPQVSEDFKIATRGSLEGIGAVIGDRDGKIVVVQPIEGSPAQKAGLLAEDHIQAVDGTSTEHMLLEEAVGHIRGVGGTEVVLMVQTGETEPREVRIVRGTIEIPSTAHAVVAREVPKVAVAGKKTDASDTQGDAGGDVAPVVETEKKDFYLLRLFSFSQTSVAAFERELRDFAKNGADSLIIDLRGNPGGYLEAAVNMAGWFLPDGAVVVREFRGPAKEEIVHRARAKDVFGEHKPRIVILVDKSSASASEILAGALKEHNVATVVGVNTYGKGSVQELVNVSEELTLKVTVARWYTPNGISISPGGLTPDIIVDLHASSTASTTASAAFADPFVEAAIQHLTGA